MFNSTAQDALRRYLPISDVPPEMCMEELKFSFESRTGYRTKFESPLSIPMYLSIEDHLGSFLISLIQGHHVIYGMM